MPLSGYSRRARDSASESESLIFTRSGSYIKPDVIYRAMYDLEMDILIIVTHMFLSFFISAYDDSTFFRASETKQSCGFERVTKTQK